MTKLIFMLFLIINWIIYKTPIAIFVPSSYFKLTIGSWNLLGRYSLVQNVPGLGTSYVSGLLGGNVVGFLNPIDGFNINGTQLTISQVLAQTSSYDATMATNIFNSLSQNVQTSLINMCGGKDTAIQYYWILNNGFTYNGAHYSIQTLSNTMSGIGNIYSAAIYQSVWYTLSPRAIELALYVSVKVFLMILAATILTSTTSSIELSYALEDILSPLKIFKFPVVEASMMIAIALRFVPSLLSESQRILNAQSSRGVDFRNGTAKDKFKAIGSLVVPLFNIAFLKSGELANAMEARSYSTRHARTRYRTFKLTFLDWFAFAGLCLLTGLLIGILIKPLIFTPFGIFELGMLIN